MRDMPMPFDFLTRRDLFRRAGCGFGGIALASMLADERRGVAAESVNPLEPKPPHRPEAKAKAVIWLFMNGGPSQVDTWDFKPELARADGKELAGFDKNTGFFANAVGGLMKSPFSFAQHG